MTEDLTLSDSGNEDIQKDKYLSSQLAGIDFSTILEAGDGQEALDVLAANDVDDILSDMK